MNTHLRPIERRILDMRHDGVAVADIAMRLKRSPEHVQRIIEWTGIPRSGPVERRSPRPIETRVLALRRSGETHEQIGRRFRRSAAFIRRVEGMAHYSIAIRLLP